MEQKQVVPPFKPNISGEFGLDNFDAQFTNEPIQLTPDDEWVSVHARLSVSYLRLSESPLMSFRSSQQLCRIISTKCAANFTMHLIDDTFFLYVHISCFPGGYFTAVSLKAIVS